MPPHPVKPAPGGPRFKVRDDDQRGGSGPDGSGVPPFDPPTDEEREEVKLWGRFMSHRQIAALFTAKFRPASRTTIERHFATELEWGKANMILEIAGKMVSSALEGDTTAGKFMLETQGEPGQFAKRVELTGKNGGPIQTLDTSILLDLDAEELEALERAASIIARLSGDGAGTSAPVPDPTGPDTAGEGAA